MSKIYGSLHIRCDDEDAVVALFKRVYSAKSQNILSESFGIYARSFSEKEQSARNSIGMRMQFLFPKGLSNGLILLHGNGFVSLYDRKIDVETAKDAAIWLSSIVEWPVIATADCEDMVFMMWLYRKGEYITGHVCGKTSAFGLYKRNLDVAAFAKCVNHSAFTEKALRTAMKADDPWELAANLEDLSDMPFTVYEKYIRHEYLLTERSRRARLYSRKTILQLP